MPSGRLILMRSWTAVHGAVQVLAEECVLMRISNAHPAGALAQEFGACVTEHAARTPTTSARRLVDYRVVKKLAENPLERL